MTLCRMTNDIVLNIKKDTRFFPGRKGRVSFFARRVMLVVRVPLPSCLHRRSEQADMGWEQGKDKKYKTEGDESPVADRGRKTIPFPAGQGAVTITVGGCHGKKVDQNIHDITVFSINTLISIKADHGKHHGQQGRQKLHADKVVVSGMKYKIFPDGYK